MNRTEGYIIMRLLMSNFILIGFQVPLQECNEETDDDREIFEESLSSIGHFSAFYPAQILPRMFTYVKEITFPEDKILIILTCFAFSVWYFFQTSYCFFVEFYLRK